ncbi:ketopantoate reductase family protein [Bradyrhizobium zhanjiangense]|uniref:2-dehydropantoate 2-reductase n=1 Tax=Bradyrhizobium zhanjiangense TaxID=1325107 RepID=A0A4Q0Q5E3_9BRAD|nr:2-dehydropantoate 2-reductase [Bradyrhizobium zhanjiangense]RXG83973.1 2-dehydropantoate 2-reductase [Bradyrhizobium zhanjiangense]
MRIAVFGTGGAGGYFGAQLALAGEDVVFIARGDHLRAIRANGLRLETPSGETLVRARATDNPAEARNVGAVLVGVKAWQVIDAANAIRPLVGPDTVIVPLQNGVEAASELMAVFASNTLGGMCGTLSFIVGPGHIRSVGGQNFIKFGEIDNRRTERVERLRQCFAHAKVSVEVPANIVKALWDKFLMVTSFGGVGSITRAPIGVTRAIPETRRLLEQCLQEALTVAKARNVPMADTAVADTMKFYDALPTNATTSLQRDIAVGKQSELDYWNGAIVRLGREVAVPTPANQFIYDCLLPSELRARRKINFSI